MLQNCHNRVKCVYSQFILISHYLKINLINYYFVLCPRRQTHKCPLFLSIVFRHNQYSQSAFNSLPYFFDVISVLIEL